ncbi:hypothetical protein KAR91_60350, partial [Candidatus Pacearchaeota archaeon]|nr:hypothetical protein [Candidatus Pacearchaeota archaeon]
MKQAIKEIMAKHVGRDNPIGVSRIMMQLYYKGTYTSDSAIRKTVRELIDDGVCIGSNNRGFFMITSHTEAILAIDNLTKRRDSL